MPLQDFQTILQEGKTTINSTLKTPEEVGISEPRMVTPTPSEKTLLEKGSPVERIKGAGKAIWENIGKAQERAGRGLETLVETQKEPSGFIGEGVMDVSKGLLGIAGGVGQAVMGTPISGAIGATPEIPAAIQGFKELMI